MTSKLLVCVRCRLHKKTPIIADTTGSWVSGQSDYKITQQQQLLLLLLLLLLLIIIIIIIIIIIKRWYSIKRRKKVVHRTKLLNFSIE